MNSMKKVKIEKVVLNIGVGKGGRELTNAEEVLKEITGQDPVRTSAKQTLQNWEIREGVTIGCKVTLRDELAIQILEKLLKAKGREIPKSNFDEFGNFSFGIEEHIEIPDIDYDPEVGIFGMNVVVRLERPGYRIMRRRRESKPVSESHRINKEEGVEFLKREFNVRVPNA